MKLTRRHAIAAFSGASAGLIAQAAKGGIPGLWPQLPDGLRDEAALEALPGKRPLIKLTYRPPNYETPLSYLDTAITPNDAFFVRYHLADIPQVNAADWKLTIDGSAAANPVSFSLDDLRKNFDFVEITAVCQCSGNRRGLFEPHVPGVQWGPGAMGCAKWGGVRLKDVLAKAGVNKEAVELFLYGADGPVAPDTPAFVKSLPIGKAMDENILIAFQMNGEALPHWNGYPVRLVVPGWTAVYWTKHLNRIEISPKPSDNFWMTTAYRIPTGKFPLVQRFISQETAANTPITEILVNSLITNLSDGQKLKAGKPMKLRGMAWDGGYGIDTVAISSDAGKNWTPAELGPDTGRFAFRPFELAIGGLKSGPHQIMVRATNRAGQVQVPALIANPAGYHHNVIQKLTVMVG